MSPISKDGTVRHASLPIRPATAKSDYGFNDIYVCRVDEVIYADDERNTSNLSPNQKPNTRLQYNVTILEGPKSGSQIFAVCDGQTSGDGNNYKLRVRRATTKKFKGPEADSWIMSDGEYVLVTFIGGSQTAPIIIGNAPHPKNSEITPKKPSSPDEEIIDVKEINGIRTTIYASGKHEVETMGGPKDANGNYTNPAAAGTKTTIGADGSITTTTGGATTTVGKDGSFSVDGASTSMSSSSSMSIKSSGSTSMKSTGVMDMDGSVMKMGGGGPSGARVGDQVLVSGMTSGGDSFTAIGNIIGGSVLSLVGG